MGNRQWSSSSVSLGRSVELAVSCSADMLHRVFMCKALVMSTDHQTAKPAPSDHTLLDYRLQQVA